jgi:hypothetical protein
MPITPQAKVGGACECSRPDDSTTCSLIKFDLVYFLSSTVLSSSISAIYHLKMTMAHQYRTL